MAGYTDRLFDIGPEFEISLNHGPVRVSTLLHPFQNIGRFDIFRFVYFAMYLDI